MRKQCVWLLESASVAISSTVAQVCHTRNFYGEFYDANEDDSIKYYDYDGGDALWFPSSMKDKRANVPPVLVWGDKMDDVLQEDTNDDIEKADTNNSYKICSGSLPKEENEEKNLDDEIRAGILRYNEQTKQSFARFDAWNAEMKRFAQEWAADLDLCFGDAHKDDPSTLTCGEIVGGEDVAKGTKKEDNNNDSRHTNETCCDGALAGKFAPAIWSRRTLAALLERQPAALFCQRPSRWTTDCTTGSGPLWISAGASAPLSAPTAMKWNAFEPWIAPCSLSVDLAVDPGGCKISRAQLAAVGIHACKHARTDEIGFQRPPDPRVRALVDCCVFNYLKGF